MQATTSAFCPCTPGTRLRSSCSCQSTFFCCAILTGLSCVRHHFCTRLRDAASTTTTLVFVQFFKLSPSLLPRLYIGSRHSMISTSLSHISDVYRGQDIYKYILYFVHIGHGVRRKAPCMTPRVFVPFFAIV